MTITEIIMAYTDDSLALMSEPVLKQAQLTVNGCLADLAYCQETEGIDTSQDRQLLNYISDFLTAVIALQLH